VQEINGDPEAALTSLLTSDRLRCRFDATNLNLSRLYRKLAKTAKTAQQAEMYTRNARDRFIAYTAFAFRGRPAPPEVSKELAEIEAECSTMASPPGSAKTNPAESKSSQQ
jgi:hypothetical protein